MRSRFAIVGLIGWLVVLALSSWLLLHWRTRVIATYGNPEAVAQWQEWQAETEAMAQQPSAVQRRAAISDEPPSLVLMRDHFAPIVASTLVVISFVYAFLVFALRGTFAVAPPPRLDDARVKRPGASTNGSSSRHRF